MINLQAQYVDTHCHLDLYKAPLDIVREAEKKSVIVVGVTNTPSVFHYTEDISKKHRCVLPAIGLHPELVLQRKQELPQMWEKLNYVRFVGEIGLDYVTMDQNTRNTQREVLTQIIEQCAIGSNKVLSVHSRRSASDVITIIGSSFPGKIILHWFSGSLSQAEKAITNGYYFSFNISMLKSAKGQLLAKFVPKDKILTETDGPFISINNKPIQPSNISETVDALAKILELSKEDLRQTIWSNFQSLLTEGS